MLYLQRRFPIGRYQQWLKTPFTSRPRYIERYLSPSQPLTMVKTRHQRLFSLQNQVKLNRPEFTVRLIQHRGNFYGQLWFRQLLVYQKSSGQMNKLYRNRSYPKQRLTKFIFYRLLRLVTRYKKPFITYKPVKWDLARASQPIIPRSTKRNRLVQVFFQGLAGRWYWSQLLKEVRYFQWRIRWYKLLIRFKVKLSLAHNGMRQPKQRRL